MALNLFNAIVMLLFSLLDVSNGWRNPAMTPPEGNSLKIKLKAYNGQYVYKCQSRKWTPLLATADIVNVSDYTHSYGNFSMVYRPSNPKFVGIWYLTNGPGDTVESGMFTSIVAGQEIAWEASDDGGIPEVLAEASYHNNYGIGYRISYILRLFTKGGLPPTQTKCTTSYGRKIPVPFEAEYWFYTQDLVPPSVPPAIEIPSGRMVMGFFSKGVAEYNYDGSAWHRSNIRGKLYDLPGGIYVGNFFAKAKADSNGGNFCLQTNNPNGWSVTAKIVGHSVQVSPDSLPWTLFKITSNSRNTSLLGPFNYLQMISTRGGLPPTATNAIAKGSVYTSLYTSIFWIFCPAT